MSSLTPRDTQLLSFVQNKMWANGRAPTFTQMRLRLGLKSDEHAKQAFTNLVEHLAHREISSFEIARRKALISETQRLLLNFSIKEAAELQDATERAVESQRNGDSSISLQAAANMCRSSAKARALFAPLFGFTGHYADPDFMEGLEKVLQGYLNQQIPDVSDNDDEIEHQDLFGGSA